MKSKLEFSGETTPRSALENDMFLICTLFSHNGSNSFCSEGSVTLW